MNEWMLFAKEFGFPALITIILIWDKIKTNGKLRKVVENNNVLLNELVTGHRNKKW